MDYDLRAASREKILAFQKALEAEFDYRECVLESHDIMLRMDIRFGLSRCSLCKEPVEGHTLVLCQARKHGTVHHLFRERAKVATAEPGRSSATTPAFDWWGM